MNQLLTISIWLITILPACNSNKKQMESEIISEIQGQLDKCAKAVETKDIDLYMDLIPEDFVIFDKRGETITREKLKEYTLRDWSIIDTTLNNKFTADSIKVYGDSATVFTSQRWERLMYQRDGVTKDTILTTQRHIETWKKTKKGWLNYDVKELGGQVFINGKEYKED